MNLIEHYLNHYNTKNDVEFQVLSGVKLNSNNKNYMERVLRMAQTGKIKIQDNLTKNEYYEILANSRVSFNCALQDWGSVTVNEADSLETNVLFPAYRSFPEMFANDHDRLYIPWSIEDASQKLHKLLQQPHPDIGNISHYNDGAIKRTLEIMQLEKKSLCYRSKKDYRNYLNIIKY